MYTNIDLKENKKMNEIIKANWRKVRVENIKKAKREKLELRLQGLTFALLIIASMIIVALIENMSF
jgi:hypothetical protein